MKNETPAKARACHAMARAWAEHDVKQEQALLDVALLYAELLAALPGWEPGTERFALFTTLPDGCSLKARACTDSYRAGVLVTRWHPTRGTVTPPALTTKHASAEEALRRVAQVLAQYQVAA